MVQKFCENEKGMKYFLIKVNENYVAPTLLGWYGTIDKKTLDKEKLYQMPKHMLFQVERHMQMVFTDVLTFPCFMVSDKIRNVIKKYDPFVYFIRIILYDNEHKKSKAYYIPYLDKVKFKEKCDEDKKSIRHILVKKEEVRERAIVEITDGNNSYVIMRMDLIESVLRRGAIGIGLQDICMI